MRCARPWASWRRHWARRPTCSWRKAGLTLVGHSSLKAALDLRWGEPGAREKALRLVLEEVDRWKRWLEQHQSLSEPASPLQEVMDTIVQIVEQDTEPAPEGGPFWGRFSLREVMMLRVFASILPQPLLPRHTSSSPGHLQARQEQARLLRLWDGRPGFGHQAAHGPWRLVEQRDQEADPAPAKDTHEPQACGTPRPRRPRGQGGDVR